MSQTNDASNNPVPSSDDTYTDADGNKIQKCNANSNGQEYYISDANAGKIIGGVISIPFTMSSIGCTSVLAIIFGSIALGIRYGGKDKKTTGGVIALLVFFFLCLISMISSIFTMRRNVNEIKKSGERPCYSTKEKKVVEND